MPHRFLGWTTAYAIVFFAVWFCGENFKSGPCTPNLDILSWLVAILFSFACLILCLWQFFTLEKKTQFPILFIHLLACTLLIFWGFI